MIGLTACFLLLPVINTLTPQSRHLRAISAWRLANAAAITQAIQVYTDGQASVFDYTGGDGMVGIRSPREYSQGAERLRQALERLAPPRPIHFQWFHR